MAQSNKFEPNVKYDTELSNIGFKGPMDLILFLIKTAEIDIKDIFVSEVTNQFLDYINNNKIDIETESEYLSIAATIIEIKSKSLIPNEQMNLEAMEEAQSFIQRIEEYKLLVESADKLKELENVDRFYKSPDEKAFDVRVKYSDVFDYDKLVDAFTQLLLRFDVKDTIENKEKEIYKEVYTVADKIIFIKNQIMQNKTMYFSELFTRFSDKSELITTFQAFLELLKHQQVTFEQDKVFGEIIIHYNENGGTEIEELEEYN